MPTEPSRPTSWSRDLFLRILAVIAALAVIRLWIQPMGNSFWLDESLIAWTIRDGFINIVPRAFISLQSIAFCAVEWLFAQIRTSEISLRLPSLLAGFGSLYVYYRIGRDAADRELGLFLAALFIATPAAAVEIPNARPYALTLFLHAGAIYWLLAWLRSGRLKHGLLWILCAAAAVHGQHLFAVAIPIETIFALWRILARKTKASATHLVICGIAGTILLIPAVPQVLAISRQGRMLSYLPQPSWFELFSAVVPLTILPALVIVALLQWNSGTLRRWTAERPGKDAAQLAALLLFIPTLAFFAVSRFTGTHIFSVRYLLPTVPAFVILWGWILRGVDAPPMRRLALAIVLILTILFLGGFSLVPDNREENWRAAVRSLPEDGVLVVYPGLVETRRLDWLQSPEHWSYFTAPVSAYRGGLSQAGAFVLPFEMGVGDQAYVDRLVAGPLRDQQRIAVIANGNQYGPAWADWLTARLTAAGYQKERESMFRAVRVRVFRAGTH